MKGKSEYLKGIYVRMRCAYSFVTINSLERRSLTRVFVRLYARTTVHSVVELDIVRITIHQALQVPLVLESRHTVNQCCMIKLVNLLALVKLTCISPKQLQCKKSFT